ncbi:PEP-CTERM sorting domain-containing protein [Akkermansiaceae bacterium]|nr:PEP-CTERM sorting domain-containing protein [Akkermansiaceae bacterium]
MKSFILTLLSVISLSFQLSASTFVFNGSGTFPTSTTSRFSELDWAFSLTYRNDVLPDINSNDGFITTIRYATAVESFQVTIGTETYIGLNTSSHSDIGITPNAGVVEIGGGDARSEYRGSVFLNGDSSSTELDIFEIVIEDTDGNSLLRPDIPGGEGLASDFDNASIETFLFAVNEDSFANFILSNDGTLEVTAVPEPGTLSFLASIGLLSLLRRKRYS